MSHKKQTNNILLHISFILLSACLLTFSFIGFHDAQIAQGAGLYIALELNSNNRLPFDLLMDGIGSLLIILTTLLPVVLLKKNAVSAYFRFVCLFLAFVPMINPGTLVHIFSEFSNRAIREYFLSANIFTGLSGIMPLLVIEVPILILIMIYNKKDFKQLIKSHTGILILLSFISCILFFIFSWFEEYTRFLSHYFILILIFEEGEFLLSKSSQKKWLAWIFYGFCALKGVYRIIMLLQTTHI